MPLQYMTDARIALYGQFWQDRCKRTFSAGGLGRESATALPVVVGLRESASGLGRMDQTADFFVSYTGADRAAAAWWAGSWDHLTIAAKGVPPLRPRHASA